MRLSVLAYWITRNILTSKLLTRSLPQVMQGGCLIAPTKPKGRPKKGTIPSLGLTFDTSSLLSTIEARKNATLLGKELATKQGSPTDYGEQLRNATTAGSSLCSVSQLMAQHGAAGELGQQFFSKVNAFGTKRTKLSFC